MPSSQYKTLSECWVEGGSVFPFTVIWCHPEYDDKELELTFVKVDGSSWYLAEDSITDYTDNIHRGYAREARYMLLSDLKKKINFSFYHDKSFTKKGNVLYSTREGLTKIKVKDWQRDQVLRKTIGTMRFLNKDKPNKYLATAIENATAARGSKLGTKVMYTTHSMKWVDKRWPSAYFGNAQTSCTVPMQDGTTKLSPADAEAAKLYKYKMLKKMKKELVDRIKYLRDNARELETTHRSWQPKEPGSSRRFLSVPYTTLTTSRSERGLRFSKKEYQVSDPDINAGVRTMNGSVLWMLIRKNGNPLLDPKIPATEHKHVGVELEFICTEDRDSLGLRLYQAGLHKHVQLKDDGSIRTEDGLPYSHEICILAKETEYEEVIKKTCIVLAAVKARVNKTCGMHVHIDVRARDKQVVFANLVSSQNILYPMNPPSRLEEVNGQRFCAFTRGRKFDETMNRYHGINASAYTRHKTIEVRIHSGTVTERKINNWIKLLLHIADRPEASAGSPRTIRGFIKQFDVPLDLADYIVERLKKFYDKTKIEEEAA